MANLDIEPALKAAVRDLLPELKQAVTDAAASAVARSMADRLMPLREAAQVLGCSYDALKKRVARGAVPVVRRGRLVRMRWADVVQLAETGAGEGAA